jgi:hypothetical protein
MTRAWLMLERAAFAVRTLARIEMYMPIYPERAEHNAPRIKANVILTLKSQPFMMP